LDVDGGVWLARRARVCGRHASAQGIKETELEERKEVQVKARDICASPAALVVVDREKISQAARENITKFLRLHGYCTAMYVIENPPKPIDLFIVPAAEGSGSGLMEMLQKLGISIEEISVQKLQEEPVQ
jgi:hypothetical protein